MVIVSEPDLQTGLTNVILTIAFSEFVPPPMMMCWPPWKGKASATFITVAPSLVPFWTMVAPAVPTAAMTRVSEEAPESIVILFPTLKPLTFATLMFIAPALAAAESGADVWVRKSVQLLSVSAPSGKRPELVFVAAAAAAAA